MGRLVYSFSVEEGSIAHRRIEQWKASKDNFSAFIVDLIEDTRALHIKALQKKVKYIRWALENKAKWNGQIHLTLFDLEELFGYHEYMSAELLPGQQTLGLGVEEE